METHEMIKQLRIKRGLSQGTLAEMVGYKDRSSIAKVEAGKVDLSESKIAAFANALGVTPAQLMDIAEDTSNSSSIYGNVALRSSFPVDLSHLKRIPILGRIPAGAPMYAEEYIEGYTYTDLNGGHEYFGLKVHGDSMDAAGIKDGYTVIVRRQDTVENGQIAVVLINSEDATLKRFSQNGNIVTLMPQSTNPIHHPFVFDLKETHVDILGLVVKVEFSPV